MTITTVWAAEGSRDLAWPRRLKVKGRRDQSVSQAVRQVVLSRLVASSES